MNQNQQPDWPGQHVGQSLNQNPGKGQQHNPPGQYSDPSQQNWQTQHDQGGNSTGSIKQHGPVGPGYSQQHGHQYPEQNQGSGRDLIGHDKPVYHHSETQYGQQRQEEQYSHSYQGSREGGGQLSSAEAPHGIGRGTGGEDQNQSLQEQVCIFGIMYRTNMNLI